MNLLPQSNGVQGKLVLLAPSGVPVPAIFAGADPNPHQHDLLLGSVQRLRGEVYLEEGAIQPGQLCMDGRHRLASDQRAWHIVLLDSDGQVAGCAKYLIHDHPVSFSRLGVADSALATSPDWQTNLRLAVEADIETARQRNIAYVEVGGWALSQKLRCTADALRIALAAYSLARLLGGCVGIGTVTQRHDSSSILRRIGGQSPFLNGTELPSYFDPNYGCQMEILRFESCAPARRFEVWIQGLSSHLAYAPVFSDYTSLGALGSALASEDLPTHDLNWWSPDRRLFPSIY